MATLAERFEAKVDRSGDHHLWRGATQAQGVGQLRVDGKLTTARRVAWELAHGPAAARCDRSGLPRRSGMCADLALADHWWRRQATEAPAVSEGQRVEDDGAPRGVEADCVGGPLRERRTPEVDQLGRYLAAAVNVVPDVAPVHTLGAVTGMRRGELVSIRRSGLDLDRGRIRVDTAIAGKRVKTTKTRVERDVMLDRASVEMLGRHCAEMDVRAPTCGTEVEPEGFVFSLEADCSQPMPAEYLTRRVAVLKEHLGISTKSPETIALEDEALRLFRSPPRPRPKGQRGPAPKGGMSFPDVGRSLGRSRRWAELAVQSAMRREEAAARADGEFFDGSILALRKFTSSERETALLAASGRSNVEIAEQLFLSRRTIENRLHRVYEKLGISGRDGLAEALVVAGVERRS